MYTKLVQVGIFPYGLVVRIPAFHVGGPGSIPGMGDFFIFILLYTENNFFNSNIKKAQIK